MGVDARGEESVSLYAKRAFPFGTYGQTRPGRTAPRSLLKLADPDWLVVQAVVR
jgi:hypothetical protein